MSRAGPLVRPANRQAPRPVLLYCAGNPLRRDDGVAAALARRLRHAGLPALRVLCDTGDPLQWLDAAAQVECLVCVDASAPARHAGRIVRIDARRRPLPAGLSPLSSHGLGLAAMLALARALQRLPARVVVYAVEAADLGYGHGLSESVAAALPRLQRRLRAELQRLQSRAGPPPG